MQLNTCWTDHPTFDNEGKMFNALEVAEFLWEYLGKMERRICEFG